MANKVAVPVPSWKFKDFIKTPNIRYRNSKWVDLQTEVYKRIPRILAGRSLPIEFTDLKNAKSFGHAFKTMLKRSEDHKDIFVGIDQRQNIVYIGRTQNGDH